ncbi:hypothetical protein [Streptacidiphilus fuscans]|uniref:Uncharacterized protein n=1 Tax=Streptacidiphilus fuscans TaxID=2789292 RepID=A0A931B6H7_9ACTN|nr:hypothetical protein [Streptacidiphilus fuscans]MBF9070342.1 hypothetical protein [Streptacidiphilus fuscans]
MHTNDALLQLAAISNGSGPGMFLRVLVIAAIVGVVIMAFVLLRGYRD